MSQEIVQIEKSVLDQKSKELAKAKYDANLRLELLKEVSKSTELFMINFLTNGEMDYKKIFATITKLQFGGDSDAIGSKLGFDKVLDTKNKVSKYLEKNV